MPSGNVFLINNIYYYGDLPVSSDIDGPKTRMHDIMSTSYGRVSSTARPCWMHTGNVRCQRLHILADLFLSRSIHSGDRLGRLQLNVGALRNDGFPSPEERQGSTRSLPGVLLIVEGINDMRQVRKYLDVDVYVMGSATKSFTPETIDNLKRLSEKYTRVVLLLDPDVAGRQARNEIDRNVEGCWHAFIPTVQATSNVKKKYKEVGDIGVEHANPKAILTAIARSRRSNPDMQKFSRERLLSMGVIAQMHERGNNVTWRRQLVCEYLGIGQCDGKQLLKQLNAYGFTEKDLMDALEYARTVMDASDV